VQHIRTDNYYNLNDILETQTRRLDPISEGKGGDSQVSNAAKTGHQDTQIKYKHEVDAVKPDKHNGWKLLVTLVFVIIILSTCILLNRQMTRYLKSEKTVLITHPRTGRLELYKGLKFKNLVEESDDRLNTTEFSKDGYPSPDLEKHRSHTDRNLLRNEENKPSRLMFEEEKYGSKTEQKDYSPFEEQESDGVL
jgi:hypothetical protein